MKAPDVKAEYARLAADYDRRYRAYCAKTHGKLLRHADDLSGSRVLDAGCGTGLLLATIGERWPDATLLGVDQSPDMLLRARSRMQERARLLQGRCEKLPLASGSVDRVLSASSLHYVTEPEQALKEFARVLDHGGILLLTDWCADSLSVRWMQRWLRWTGRASYALRGSAMPDLLQTAGFAVEGLERYSAGFPWRMFLVRARRAD